MVNAEPERMPLKTLLRLAIVAEVLFGMLGAVADIMLERHLPEPLREYLAAESESWSSTDTAVLLIAVPVLIALIVAWIGLWRLWPPARPLYLYSWIASIVIVAFTGPAVSSAVGYMFGEGAILAAGFILGLIYFSDLRHAFEHPQSI
jgi:hypothetical protein